MSAIDIISERIAELELQIEQTKHELSNIATYVDMIKSGICKMKLSRLENLLDLNKRLYMIIRGYH